MGAFLRNKYVQESERGIPIIDAVDVLVIGGQTAGVTAALAAVEHGCSVFLVEQNPYLGFDMCGTYRLWLNANEKPSDELERQIYGWTDDPVTQQAPPTLMQVKYSLEQALLQANVKFLYCCYPTNIIIDQAWQPAGIVIGNRAGRQGIKAKVIIDATTRATVARLAGAKFSQYPSGVQSFQRVVVGDLIEPRKGAEISSVQAMPSVLRKNGGGNQAFEYQLEIQMDDGSLSSFAKAEQVARDLTWDANQVDASEVLFQIPPDSMQGQISLDKGWPGADLVDLKAFNPANSDRLYVLGGCADLSRHAAADFLRPLEYMAVGRRIGKHAALQASELSFSSKVQIKKESRGTTKLDQLDTKEILQGIRPTDQGLPMLDVSSDSLPVIGEYDVVVVGGGTAGAAAAISAARQGLKTLVLESSYGLGGLGTVGHVSTYFAGYRGGFTKEIDDGVQSLGGLPPWRDTCWNIESKMEWYRREVLQAGGEIWFHTIGIGMVVADNCAKGVVLATGEGRRAVVAKVVIDATGNADMAIAAGAKYMFTDEQHAGLQGTGIGYRDLYPVGKYGFVNLDWTYVEESDLVNVWHALTIGKHRFAAKNKYDLVHMIQTRERRRIVGDYVLSPLDIVNKKTFSDTICQAYSGFDSHGFFVHDLFLLNPTEGNYHANIPYRCLLPEGIEGMFVTGLGVSAHRDAMPVIRMQSDVQNQGYAVGVAAAMAIKNNCLLRDIDIKKLQHHLVQLGSLQESVLTDQDTQINLLQVTDAVQDLATDGYEKVSVILAANRKQAIDLLREAYLDPNLGGNKLRLAHVLAVLGDQTGIDRVIRAVESFAEWDEGWQFRVYGIYGDTRSYLDSLIIALGISGSQAGLEPIIEKAKLLNVDSAFSHFRAVAVALESLGDVKGAKVLAELLSLSGMKGYAVKTHADAQRLYYIGDVTHTLRDHSLRELILARALYRTGDYQGIGQSILEQYSSDLRSHYARHALAVLNHPASNQVKVSAKDGGKCLS